MNHHEFTPIPASKHGDGHETARETGCLQSALRDPGCAAPRGRTVSPDYGRADRNRPGGTVAQGGRYRAYVRAQDGRWRARLVNGDARRLGAGRDVLSRRLVPVLQYRSPGHRRSRGRNPLARRASRFDLDADGDAQPEVATA